MSTASFRVLRVENTGYHAPDGRVRVEPWWSEPAAPASLPHSSIAENLIEQINEDIGGKQSCGLTSQLNALVVRQAIETADATFIQDTLASDPAYTRYWHPSERGDFVGWSGSPYALAFTLKEDFDVPVAVKLLDCADDFTDIEAKLHDGLAIALIGRSVVGRHTRLAFETEDSNGRLFIHDPKYPETTGFYDYDQLPSFQTSGIAVAY